MLGQNDLTIKARYLMIIILIFFSFSFKNSSITLDTVLFFAKKSVAQSFPQVCIVQRVAVLYAN